MGDIGPAANTGEAVGQRLDIAANVIEPRDLGGEPLVRHVAAFADIGIEPADHARMVHRSDLAEVGEAADGPQAPGLNALLGDDRRILGDELEHCEVDRLRRGAQEWIVALRFEAADQRSDVAEIEIGVAPVERIERAEAVLLDRVDLFLAEAAAVFAKA